jgi:signal transduction histidine kinase
MPVIASEARLARWLARERDRNEARWRRWLPRWTVRLRLTVLYGALFLVAGAGLLAITYGLVVHNENVGSQRLFVARGIKTPAPLPPRNRSVRFPGGTATLVVPPPPGVFARVTNAAKQIRAQAVVQVDKQAAAQRSALLTQSGIALGIMAFISIGLGWLMAGRALGPLQEMNRRVRRISEHNLHERLTLEGHDDEFKELGDTFDGLLERLEGAFVSQRRFVANASHELRTPVTLERTLLEVALADPDADAASLRAVCGRVLAAGEQQERTIDALLTLARSQRGLDARSPVDLAAVAAEVAEAAVAADGGDARVRVERSIEPALTSGDPALVERLTANLLDNAIRHNHPHGWVRISTGISDWRPALRVANSGPVIAADQVDSLREPFRRLNGDRTGHSGGVGLGLSIVDAIACAHGAEVEIQPRPDGGLEVEVTFPAPPRTPS